MVRQIFIYGSDLLLAFKFGAELFRSVHIFYSDVHAHARIRRMVMYHILSNLLQP